MSLDTVMLGFMTTDADVGYYNAAVKIKTILVSSVTSLGAVLLPRASYYVENEMLDDFKKITCKALNFVFLIASPLVVYFYYFCKRKCFFPFGGFLCWSNNTNANYNANGFIYWNYKSLRDSNTCAIR